MTETSTETRSVVVEREVAFPPEKIWRALTRPHPDRGVAYEELISSQVGVGHRFNLRKNPQPNLNIVIDCQVLVVEPNKTLSYTWAAYDLDGVVTWTLTPTSTGDAPAWSSRASGRIRSRPTGAAKGGWRQCFANLEQVLARID